MRAHLFLIVHCFIGLCSVFANGYLDELSTLLAIKSSLIDPSDHLNDWKMPGPFVMTSSQHCNWTGVSCNSKGVVERLDLSYINLSGRVSERIRDLSSLVDLNLCCNNFSSALPDELGYAASLTVLDFTGNYFQGSIPSSFKNLQKLKFLGLSSNNLSGKIPVELGQLSSLETMLMGYNQFEGPIPVEFGNLTKLHHLELPRATLGGQIPAELGKLKRLTTLNLHQNNFGGKIPPEIGSITSLLILDLSNNQISGQIPNEIAELENLQWLGLKSNRLSGPIPEKLGELKNLEYIELWQNSLSGSLPLNLGRYSSLQLLDVSSNSLSGEIPPGLCDSGNLTALILFNNSFSGPFPTSLLKCSALAQVRIQNNHLSGSIPSGFGTLPTLERLELANNNITGEIPQDISLSTSLSYIDVSRNRLDSLLPSGILSIPTLLAFIASSNNLQGKIPDQLKDCPLLSVLDLSYNHLSGNIPWSIASCGKLMTLNLRRNQLSGEIPRAIASMPMLTVADLSNNSLVGRIPEDFGSSPVFTNLNVSFNKLEGPLPNSGVLTNTRLNNIIGNPGLCGGILPPCSESNVSPPRPRKAPKNIVEFIVGILSVILAAGIIVFFTWRLRYRKLCLYGNKKNESEWQWRLVPFQRLHFTRADILDCIKESNVIGAGGTGIVYKAEIQRLNTAVAVKKLSRSEAVEIGDDLLAEVNLLGVFKHRNIVKNLGYLHNKTDIMMLCEHMPNGSLGAALHGKQPEKLLVDWVLRYHIALGVAKGLAYLHHDCHPPVIHGDVKSNNILLDSHFEARIADVGLARIADVGLARTMLHKNETVSMEALEYGYTLTVDGKSEIYNYGVVLLELLTGKMPLDPSFGEGIDVVEWVRREVNKSSSPESVLDPDIAVAGQCEHIQEEMIRVLEIALLCTADHAGKRPSMRDVAEMLVEIMVEEKERDEKEAEVVDLEDEFSDYSYVNDNEEEDEENHIQRSSMRDIIKMLGEAKRR